MYEFLGFQPAPPMVVNTDNEHILATCEFVPPNPFERPSHRGRGPTDEEDCSCFYFAHCWILPSNNSVPKISESYRTFLHQPLAVGDKPVRAWPIVTQYPAFRTSSLGTGTHHTP